MAKDFVQVNRAISEDGTEIVGQVKGQGPPLVLLPAGPGDSKTTWRFMLPFLSEHFTCYLVDTRGRGLSVDSADHSLKRLVQDIVAFIKSIGEQVGLLEWGSTLWIHCYARDTTNIAAIAAYEPGLDDMLSEDAALQLEELFTRMGSMVSDGKLAEAVDIFIENGSLLYTEADLASGAPEDFWMNSTSNFDIFFREEELIAASKEPGPSHPSLLAKIDVPVLLLEGSATKTWFKDSVLYMEHHLPDSTVRQVVGTTHFGPYLKPEAIATELISFFKEHLG